MQRTQQWRLHGKLSLSQLCGKTTVEYYLNTTHMAHVGQLIHLCGCPTKLDVLIPAQGSYHCGSCKSGFTGDQVKGCKPEMSCGNSLTNPCDINAQCIAERDGSIHCQVGFQTFFTHTLTTCTHKLHISTTPYTRCLSFLCLVSVELAGLVTDTCVGRIPTLTDTQMTNSNAKI